MDIREEENTVKEKGMERKKPNSFLFALLLVSFSGSLTAEIMIQKKLLFFFDKIEVRGNVDVFLVEGKRLREASIYADAEIIDSIQVRVSQKTLFIDANNTYEIARRLPFLRLKAERTFPVEIVISIDELKEIRLLGQSNLTAHKLHSDQVSLFMASSGKLHIEDIVTKELNVVHDSAGDILLKGNEVNEIKIKISENGSLFAEELEVERATLIHQGNGVAHLNPKNWLDARIHGNGNLFLHAKPDSLVIDQQGTGMVSDILPDSPSLYDLNVTE